MSVLADTYLAPVIHPLYVLALVVGLSLIARVCGAPWARISKVVAIIAGIWIQHKHNGPPGGNLTGRWHSCGRDWLPLARSV